VRGVIRPAAVLVAAVVLLVATGAGANPLKSVENLFEKWGLFQGVQVSGNNTLTLQEHSIEGASSVFESQRWDTGSLQRRTSLSVEGPIWKEFGFRTDLSFSGYGARYSRWLVGYVGHDTGLYFGDLNISLRNNEFASFAKSLKGWQLDQKLPSDGVLRAFSSEQKGYTRNETLSGNDTPGPYFLRYTPIIDGSESVKVDEEFQLRGVDYRLDYQSGELWFSPVEGPSRAIPSTSTISVSYQSSGYFGNAGTLTGLRVQAPLKRGKVQVGVTWLEQDRPEAGQGDTVSYQEDVYYGSGTTGPFDTNFRPIIADGAQVIYQGSAQTIAEALKVLMDNVPMQEGVDYDAYRQIGRIIFRLAVPPTALVRIQYYYELGETALSSDVEVRGFDLGYQVSDDLSLRTDFAQSESQGSSGSALQTILSYRRPRYDLLATYRDVEPRFSYIDSTGFRRNDRGLKLDLGWQPSRHIRVRSALEDSESTAGLSFGYSGYGGGVGFDTGLEPFQAAELRPTQDTTPVQNVSVKRRDWDVELRFPGWPVTTLRRQTMANSGGAQSNSDYTRTSVDLSHAFSNKLRTQLSLTTTDQRNAGSTGSSTGSFGSETRQRRVSLDYAPSSRLSLRADLGKDRSVAVGGEGGRSESDYTRLHGSWSPSDKLNLSLERSGSTSLGRVSSGFYGGFPGSGHGGGGGLPGPIAGAVPAALSAIVPASWPAREVWPCQDDDDEPYYKDTSTSFTASYQPSRKLSLMLTSGQRKYLSGGGSGYLSDSDQKYRSLALTWQATSEITLTTNFSQDDLQFLQAGRGSVSNDSLIMGLNYRPQDKPWDLNVSINRMTGSSPSYILIGGRERYYQTDTGLRDLSGQFSYRLGNRSSLMLRASTSEFDSDYSAFSKKIVDLGLNYEVGRNNRLTFGYRFIGHRAGQSSSPFLGYTGVATQGQDYNAHTFMLSLQSNFASGMGASRFRGPTSTMDSGPRRGTFGGYQPGLGDEFSTYGGADRRRQGGYYQGSGHGWGGGYEGGGSYNTFPQW